MLAASLAVPTAAMTAVLRVARKAASWAVPMAAMMADC
jgi:hypothetical protein